MSGLRRKREIRIKLFWRDDFCNGRIKDELDYICVMIIIFLRCLSGYNFRLKEIRF